MEVRGRKGGEDLFSVSPLGLGTQKFVYDQGGRVCLENRSETGKPWKESAFTAVFDNQFPAENNVKKWRWNLFSHSLNIAVVVALKLHMELHTATSDQLPHLDFRRRIIIKVGSIPIRGSESGRYRPLGVDKGLGVEWGSMNSGMEYEP
ncbi:hypothetical protein T07_6841 [Trichinella nelsoni]|uniref:Uncharacterized protein n=1 Tax=Trichinella nelsoni TaxID=6336 RepID=A0A0V0RS16_9BILA|nr:hypothetical protein T07_6841 [Trichinella nelsoni]